MQQVVQRIQKIVLSHSFCAWVGMVGERKRLRGLLRCATGRTCMQQQVYVGVFPVVWLDVAPDAG